MEALLKRVGLPVETVNADPTVLSFVVGSRPWRQMLERIIALFGADRLGQALTPEEVERLKAEELVGGEDVTLRFRS